MEFSLTDTEFGLHYNELGTTAWWRGVFAGAGITAIASSYVFVELIPQVGEIDGASKLGSVVAAISGIVAFCLFGGYCLNIALTLPRQSILFHRDRKQLTYIAHSPAFGARETKYPFGSISRLKIMECPSEDTASTFTIEITIPGSKPIQLGVFAQHAQALESLGRIQRVVADAC